MNQRSSLRLCALGISLLLLCPSVALAFTVTARASLSYQDNQDCTATYYGLHWAQFGSVTSEDIGKEVGLEGKLWRHGSLTSSQVSSCNGGGVLSGSQTYICETSWTQPCLNPAGPQFQARTHSFGSSGESGNLRILCAEGHY